MELPHVDLTGLSAAQRDVLHQALESYAMKMARRHVRAEAPPIREEARWRAYVAAELLKMIDGE